MVAPPGYLPGSSFNWQGLLPYISQSLSGLGQGLLAAPNFGQGLGLGLQQANQNIALDQQRRQQAEMLDLQKKKLEHDLSAAETDLVQAVDPADGQLKWMPKSKAAGLGSQKDKPFVPNIESITKGGSQESGYFNQNGEWVALGSGPRFAPTQGAQPTEFSTWLSAFQRDNGRPPTAQEVGQWNKLKGGTEYKNVKLPTGELKTLPVGPDLDAAVKAGGIITGTTMQLTEAQAKSGMQYAVANQANQKLDKVEGVLTGPADYIASKFGTVGNYAKSDEYRQAEQAAGSVAEMYLRAITGAAATSSEIERVKQNILPLPGDDAGTIAQKKAQRQMIVETLRLMSGSMAGQVDTISGANEAPATGGSADIDAILGKDPRTWTAEERAVVEKYVGQQ